MNKKLLRRDILKNAGMAGAALSVAPSLAYGNTNASVSTGFDELEKLYDISYSDQERELLDGVHEKYLDRIRKRRQVFSPENHEEPALSFHPLLKGEQYPEMANQVTLSSNSAGPLPNNDKDIAFAPVWKQAEWLRKTGLSSQKLVEIYLNRIDRYNPHLLCFVTVTRETAMKKAKQADRELSSGNDRGKLHGIPYGLKDLIDTADIQTSWGAKPYEGRVPNQNATIVDRLNRAGAVLIGKTSLGALAYGDKWYGGVTRNPWAPDEGSSGSSAGSASATASGLVSFSIGTETLGSIVSPSNRCGVVGLRPTFGRIPRTGAMALCWSLDKIGAICRFAEDIALVLQTLNGDDAQDKSSFDWGFDYDGTKQNRDITIGYDPYWFKKASDVEKNTLQYLRHSGFSVVETRLPDLPYQLLLSILEVEAAAAFEELTLSDKDDLLSWQEKESWPNIFRAARSHSALEILQLDRFRYKIMRVMNDVFKEVDMLISLANVSDLLFSTNFTGHPCLTIPVGLTKRNLVPLTQKNHIKQKQKKYLPRNIVLWGNMLREDQLIKVGNILENQISFEKNRPSLIF